MNVTIRTNVYSLVARRNIAQATRDIERSVERLSSGLRINSAADDPSGLRIADGLKSKIRSLESARRNAEDGVSLTDVADGTLDEVNNMLTRMRELAVESLNGTLSTDDRDVLQEEFDDLRDEIGRLASTTEFNDIGLLDGQVTSVKIHVGHDPGAVNRVTIELADTRVTTLGIATIMVNVGTTASDTAIDKLDIAIGKVSEARGKFGAAASRLEAAESSIDSLLAGFGSAESAIRDADIAEETADLVRSQIIQEAGIAVLTQSQSIYRTALKLLSF